MLFTDPTRTSTLLLTALMVIGLGFFIRASTKDRIEVMQFGSTQSVELLQQAIMRYFQSRAYQPISEPTDDPKAMDPKSTWAADPAAITVSGMVSPSIFMAVFLSGLAAVGFACLALIIATLFPEVGQLLFALVLLSPLAGTFYWRKSSRPEQVTFKVESSGKQEGDLVSRLIVKGHRDELAELQTAFAPFLRAWS
ncbi:MAG: cofactor assembly of complex C subunit B [Cyanobacteria bacterium J06560_2]